MNAEARHLCKEIMNGCINSPLSKSSCDFEIGDGATTIDTSCYVNLNTKSSAVQTNKNRVRNKTTSTGSQLIVPRIERETESPGTRARVCDIHAIITLNVVARNPDDCPNISVGPSDIRVLTDESPLTDKKKKSKRRSKCTCTSEECAEKGGCVESCKYSCKYGGLGPCSAFSLGTADYRMLLREKCHSMLIGGCRVPVCRNFKNRV